MFACNTFNTPNLGNYSLYELTHGRKPRPILNLDSNPDIKVSGMFKEYYYLLNKRLKYLHDILLNFKSKRAAMTNKDRAFFQYKVEIWFTSDHPLLGNCTQHHRKLQLNM